MSNSAGGPVDSELWPLRHENDGKEVFKPTITMTPVLQTTYTPATTSADAFRVYLEGRRQSLLQELAAIDKALGIEQPARRFRPIDK